MRALYLAAVLAATDRRFRSRAGGDAELPEAGAAALSAQRRRRQQAWRRQPAAPFKHLRQAFYLRRRHDRLSRLPSPGSPRIALTSPSAMGDPSASENSPPPPRRLRSRPPLQLSWRAPAAKSACSGWSGLRTNACRKPCSPSATASASGTACSARSPVRRSAIGKPPTAPPPPAA